MVLELIVAGRDIEFPLPAAWPEECDR